MLGLSANERQSEGWVGSRSGDPDAVAALVARPRGRGGVAGVIDAVSPHLGPTVHVQPVSVLRRPTDGLKLANAVRRANVVHLHPSFRFRAVLRDGLIHRALRATGRRTLVHWHGVDHRLVRWLDGHASARRTLRRLYGDADHTFVLTAEFARALNRWGLGPAEVAVNPAPTGPSRRAPEPGRLLFVGRCEPAKGLPDLVVALGLLRRRHRATLAVAGSGSFIPYGPGIERLGWVDATRLRAELARATALVLPTRDDAAPLVVLEALAAGCPVVATRVGAIPDMVGESGVLIDRPDPASIAAAVERAWQGPRSVFPDLARHHPAAVAAHWHATYRAIAS